MTEGRMAHHRPNQASNEGVEHRLLVGALFVSCLPTELARWARPSQPAPRRSPFASALDAARDTAAHVFSLPG